MWAGYLPPHFVAGPRLLTTINTDMLNDDDDDDYGLRHVV